MKVRFEQYSDEVYYEPLNESKSEDSLNFFVDQFKDAYQSDKIKLDISIGLGLKYLDIIDLLPMYRRLPNHHENLFW